MKFNLSYEKQYINKLVSATDYSNGCHCEIGSKDGNSVHAALIANENVKVISIDPAHTNIFNKEFSGNARVIPIRKDSSKALSVIDAAKYKISSVFIDGNHTYKWVKHDIGKYWRRWDQTGFFCGHDFLKKKAKKREDSYGIIPAVCEFFGVENYKKIKLWWEVKDGVLFVAGTLWCYITNDNLPKYETAISEML